MKFAYGMFGYLASAAAVVALSITTVSYALAPTEAAVAAEKAETTASAVTSAAAPIPEARIVDGERVPVWIAPTTKYPASALALNTAPRAKQIAREGNGGDWRLNGRADRFEEPMGMSSYAAETRMQRDTFGYYQAPSYYRDAPVYRESRSREPMQFRERSEPR